MRRATVTSLLIVAVLAAACGSGGPSPSGDAPTGSATSAPADSAEPASPGGSIATPKPTKTPAPAKSPTPSPAASGTPDGASAEPSASSAAPASAGIADACQPQGSNPNFWPGISSTVSWAVYCAVLPSGWFVNKGTYRQANGGSLVITYKGPGGATLSLSEGSFCTDGSGCVPSGSDSGDAQFGSMSGTLVTLDGGGYAIVVARGQQPSWLMVTQGLDQATTTSLGAALAKISG